MNQPLASTDAGAKAAEAPGTPDAQSAPNAPNAPHTPQVPNVQVVHQALPVRWIAAGAVLLAALCAAAVMYAWNTQQRVKGLEQQLVKRQQDSAEQSAEAQLLAKQAQEAARESAAKVALLEARDAEVSVQRTQLEALIQTMSRSQDLAVPARLSPVASLPSDDVAIRVTLESEESVAILASAGWRQVSLEEWFHPPGFLRHLVRREEGAVRVDEWDLARFWERLVSATIEEGLLLGPDAELRAVVGTAGSFFGRYMTPGVEGRWREQPPTGVWCAYRRGHGDSRWLPTLVSVDGDVRRALDLFDDDEWRCALLARSKELGAPEDAHRAEGEVRVTWPLPAQLRAAMDIIGVPAGPWRWRVAEDAPDLWSLLR